MEINFSTMKNMLSNELVYIIIGNGTKNQFRDLRKIKGVLNKILKGIPLNSNILYFGDNPDKKNPDIGYIFQLISEVRKDIKIYMIQIKAAKEWGMPKFVDCVYWHNDYTDECKWGGVINGKPCSNSKQWLKLHKSIKNGITKVFILGGGKITLDEYNHLIKKNNIDCEYFPVERKYKGDGITKVTDKDTIKDKVGITLHKIK